MKPASESFLFNGRARSSTDSHRAREKLTSSAAQVSARRSGAEDPIGTPSSPSRVKLSRPPFPRERGPHMPTEIVFSGGPTVQINAEPLEVANQLRAGMAIGALMQLGQGDDAVYVSQAAIAYLRRVTQEVDGPILEPVS